MEQISYELELLLACYLFKLCLKTIPDLHVIIETKIGVRDIMKKKNPRVQSTAQGQI